MIRVAVECPSQRAPACRETLVNVIGKDLAIAGRECQRNRLVRLIEIEDIAPIHGGGTRAGSLANGIHDGGQPA